MGLMLAAILAKNVERVLLWLPESSMAHQWSGRKHIRLLNLDFEIPSNVRIVSGYRLFQQGSHFIASVVPARQFEEVHEHVVTHMNRTNQHAIITFSKGFLSSVGRRKYQVATFSEFLARAMEAYQRASLLEAREHFLKLKADCPDDPVIQFHLDRIHRLEEQGIPENWEGIENLTKK